MSSLVRLCAYCVGLLVCTASSVLAGEDPRAIENLRWGDEFGAPIGCDAPIADAVHGPDGEIYLVGSFRACGGVEANYVVRYQPETGAWSPLGSGDGNGLNEFAVSVLLIDRMLYVAGRFTEANSGESISANRIARFDLDAGEWSALGSGQGNGVNNHVYTMVTAADGSIYIGGEFTEANVGDPLSVNRIARWDTGLELWSQLPGSDVLGGFVLTIQPDRDRLLVATSNNKIHSYGGGDQWILLGPGGPEGSAHAFAVDGSDVYVGGLFDHIARADGSRILSPGGARWSSVDGQWYPLGGGLWQFDTLTGRINDLSIDGDRLYVAGTFNYAINVDPVLARGFAVWRISTGQWETLDGNDQTGPVFPSFAAPTATSVVAENDKVIFGGHFDRIQHGNGITDAVFLVFYDASTDTWTAPASEAAHGTWRGGIFGMTTLGADIYIGGTFAGVADLHTNALAAWNGQQWRRLGNSPISEDVDVFEVKEFHGKLAIAAYFGDSNSSGPLNQHHVLLWDPTNSTWELIGDLTDSTFGPGLTRDIAVMGDDLYIGGTFTSVTDQHGTLEVNRIARWNRVTRRWSVVGSDGGNGVEGHVTVLQPIGEDLFVGGSIFHANAGPSQVEAHHVARWDGLQWHALVAPEGEGANGHVYSIAADDQYLYVGGRFQSVAGGQVPAVRIARWRLDGGAWEAVANGLGTHSDDTVHALMIQGDWLYAGGRFEYSADQTQVLGHVARWKPGDPQWSTMGAGLGPFSRVQKLLVQDDQLYVAGSISLAGTNSSRSIARYQLRGALDLTIAGRGSGRVVSAPAGINCASNCVAQFEWDQDITLTAQAGASSNFAGWNGDCAGAGACTIRFDRARFVQATFDSEADLFANDFE